MIEANDDSVAVSEPWSPDQQNPYSTQSLILDKRRLHWFMSCDGIVKIFSSKRKREKAGPFQTFIFLDTSNDIQAGLALILIN